MMELCRIEVVNEKTVSFVGSCLRFRFVDEFGVEYGIETVFPPSCSQKVTAGTLMDLANTISKHKAGD